MINVKEFVGYKKVPNYNLTLRSFLSYLTKERSDFRRELNNDYTTEEKNTFIYNCAIITINDFFSSERFYEEPKYANINISQMFEDNFKLRQFDTVEVAQEVPNNARKMIELYKELLNNNIDRVTLMRNSRKLIASVD